MKRSPAVVLLGPGQSAETAPADLAWYHRTDFVPCAVVDPGQGQTRRRLGGLPVFDCLRLALQETGAATLIYNGSFIDVNGFGEVLPRETEDCA